MIFILPKPKVLKVIFKKYLRILKNKFGMKVMGRRLIKGCFFLEGNEKFLKRKFAYFFSPTFYGTPPPFVTNHNISETPSPKNK